MIAGERHIEPGRASSDHHTAPAPEGEPRETVHAVAVRADQDDTEDAETEPVDQPQAVGDRWDALANQVCATDPNGRRDPGKVAAILRLRHEFGRQYAAIAEEVGVSTSTVTRTLAAARSLTDTQTENLK